MRRTQLLFIAILTAGGPALSAGPLDVPALRVSETAGVYTVAATFNVPEMPDDVIAVLTDYEQIPRFMPGVRTSLVRERANGRAVVEQEAVSKMAMFSKRVHLVLEVQEHSGGITFLDRCGKSFTRYDGAWRVTRKGNVTAIVYELTADPAFDVPEFVLTRLLRRDSAKMIEQLQREIARRTALRHVNSPTRR
ncbi:MAG: SRPBCC family protein [Vicinamibacterales bacterium]